MLSEHRPSSGLRLILKVGGGNCSTTPEHSDSALSQGTTFSVNNDDSFQQGNQLYLKKSRKKKKKKDRKHEKRKKHHKDKKKRHDDDCIIICDDSFKDGDLKKEPGEARPGLQSNQDNGGGSGCVGGREPRLCVQLLRQKQEKNALQRMLDYLQRQLEKKDPQQFFAWPVTDQIAPGYSLVISSPMDFSTIKQKIDDNEYQTLDSYVDDFRLMCNNAMTYNKPDTIYYKAAKRLLHAGLKILNPSKLCQLASSIPGIAEVTKEQLGFHLGTGQPAASGQSASVPSDATDEDSIRDTPHLHNAGNKLFNSSSHYEADAMNGGMTAEQILEQAQRAAQATSEKLSLKRPRTSMGFLRQQVDGSTSLAVLIPGEGVNPERPRERSVSLGQMVGKLNHGSGQLQGFKEDRRNVTKTVKPLNYGAFGSYAPSYDSTFANISKEESDLLYETYGDENATAYAESVLNFAKDCDYTLTMVDNLLDLLTGGEHRKVKGIIEEQRKLREEEEKVRELMEGKPVAAGGGGNSGVAPGHPKPYLDELKTLSELGIDVSFLTYFENGTGEPLPHGVQNKLDQTTVLIEKLQQVQNDRLSTMPPPHLSQVLQPSDTELHLAEKITESLTELAKQVPPGAIIPVPAIRKAMGIVPDPATNPPHAPSSTSSIHSGGGGGGGSGETTSGTGNGEATGTTSGGGDEETCGVVGVVSQLDLESELREFLESDSALNSFPLQDDKTIEEMLSQS